MNALNAIIGWSLRHRATVVIGWLALAVVGAFSFLHLPMDAFPDTTPVQVQVNATAALAGQPVLVHFWATWCVPCRTELPGLIAAAREEDVRILAVTDEPWDAVSAYFNVQIPEGVGRDPSGGGASAARSRASRTRSWWRPVAGS